MGDSVLGIEVPDTRPVFLAVLLVHVLAGGTAVVSGAVAARARKRPGRHPRSGRVYLWALGVVFATAAALTVLRWPHNIHLLVLGTLAFAAGGGGWLARRGRRPGWVRRHILGMGTSYVVLLTAFYVDNGPRLPLWNLLPDWAFWILPAAVGTPVITRALARHGSGPRPLVGVRRRGAGCGRRTPRAQPTPPGEQ
ncbi:MAG: hypothetical protein ACRDPT_04280 [Streptomycetales bacterium]